MSDIKRDFIRSVYKYAEIYERFGNYVLSITGEKIYDNTFGCFLSLPKNEHTTKSDAWAYFYDNQPTEMRAIMALEYYRKKNEWDKLREKRRDYSKHPQYKLYKDYFDKSLDTGVRP